MDGFGRNLWMKEHTDSIETLRDCGSSHFHQDVEQVPAKSDRVGR